MRSEETLRELFDFFDEKRDKQLRCICCDMWMPSTTVIEQRPPTAVLLFDKFHIVPHLMDAVDQLGQ